MNADELSINNIISEVVLSGEKRYIIDENTSKKLEFVFSHMQFLMNYIKKLDPAGRINFIKKMIKCISLMNNFKILYLFISHLKTNMNGMLKSYFRCKNTFGDNATINDIIMRQILKTGNTAWVPDIYILIYDMHDFISKDIFFCEYFIKYDIDKYRLVDINEIDNYCGKNAVLSRRGLKNIFITLGMQQFIYNKKVGYDIVTRTKTVITKAVSATLIINILNAVNPLIVELYEEDYKFWGSILAVLIQYSTINYIEILLEHFIVKRETRAKAAELAVSIAAKSGYWIPAAVIPFFKPILRKLADDNNDKNITGFLNVMKN